MVAIQLTISNFVIFTFLFCLILGSSEGSLWCSIHSGWVLRRSLGVPGFSVHSRGIIFGLFRGYLRFSVHSVPGFCRVPLGVLLSQRIQGGSVVDVVNYVLSDFVSVLGHPGGS